VPFIGWRREGRRCRGGETADNEWSFSMLPFQREERMGAVPISEGEKRTQGGSWFPRGGATGGCSGVTMTDSWSWVERLFRLDIVVDIK
jgi:hypothetical protein